MTCNECGRDEGHHLGCPATGYIGPLAHALTDSPDPEDPNVTPEEEPGEDGIEINPGQEHPLPADAPTVQDPYDRNDLLPGQRRANEDDDQAQEQALVDTTDSANADDAERETVEANRRKQNLSDEELEREENTRQLQETKPELVTEKHDPEPVEPRAQCAFDGCENPKASAAKNAKYCEDHKDPKNRKE